MSQGHKIVKEGDKLSLLFPDGVKKSTIGYLDPADPSIISMYRDKEKHLMKKLDAYGFNYQFMSVAAKGNIETIILKEKDTSSKKFRTYQIPIGEIAMHGIHQQIGNYEKQIFYPLSRLHQQPYMEKDL
jgi:hypothetical protein